MCYCDDGLLSLLVEDLAVGKLLLMLLRVGAAQVIGTGAAAVYG
jgi:hypothetical protein